MKYIIKLEDGKYFSGLLYVGNIARGTTLQSARRYYDLDEAELILQLLKIKCVNADNAVIEEVEE